MIYIDIYLRLYLYLHISLLLNHCEFRSPYLLICFGVKGYSCLCITSFWLHDLLCDILRGTYASILCDTLRGTRYMVLHDIDTYVDSDYIFLVLVDAIFCVRLEDTNSVWDLTILSLCGTYDIIPLCGTYR